MAKIQVSRVREVIGLLHFGSWVAQSAFVTIADSLDVVPVLPNDHDAGYEAIDHVGIGVHIS